MPGPPPKRSDQRRKPATSTIDKVEVSEGPVAQPAPNPEWHEIARDWYCSLTASGQSRFYEPSDWQTARIWAEVVSRQLFAGVRMSGQMMATWHSATGDLLTTEGARRRARVEVERAQSGEDAAATPPPAAKPDSKARLRSVAAS